ncbi:SDR family oxidoreductase [Micromonospora sp. NBC_01739]|nr:SDR family oxidoreductase [Micromonospora sp. NBC_01739]
MLVVGRSEETLAQTAAGHDTIVTLAVDITRPNAPNSVVDTALGAFGRVDVLVNNAAVGEFGGLADVGPAMVGAQIDTNLLAPVFLTQRALDALAESSGTVVNVGTAGSLGLRPWADNAIYGASKAALDFLTRSWAVELAPRGIRVVSVHPRT